MSEFNQLDNFEKLFTSEDNITQEKIISMFYDATKNLNMKTEIPASALMALCFLEAYGGNLKKIGLTQTGNLTLLLVKLYKELMVSRDRKGREEAGTFLGAIRQQLAQSSVLSRLFGMEKG